MNINLKIYIFTLNSTIKSNIVNKSKLIILGTFVIKYFHAPAQFMENNKYITIYSYHTVQEPQFF